MRAYLGSETGRIIFFKRNKAIDVPPGEANYSICLILSIPPGGIIKIIESLYVLGLCAMQSQKAVYVYSIFK